MAAARPLQCVNLACAFLSGVAMLMMMAAGAADIVFSNLDKVGLPSRPIPAAFEFMATMMVVVVFLGIPLAQARRNHIRVELPVRHLPPAACRGLEFAQHALSALLFGLVAWFGWQAGLHSFRVGEFAAGLINYPIWPARFTLAFGATLMTVQCLRDAAAVFLPGAGGEEDSCRSGPGV
ncbi:MAG: TRAP transporter small permease [Pseudomonadota bacterium]